MLKVFKVMRTKEEMKAIELDELFQMEEDLTEICSSEQRVAERILEHLREIKEYFKQMDDENT